MKLIFACVLLLSILLPCQLKAQGYRMDLPPLKTFSPTDVNITNQSFVASWEAQDNSVDRSILAYVGLERQAMRNGVQNVLETTIKGDPSLAEDSTKSLGLNAYLHDYMTTQGWFLRMGEVSKKGIILKTNATLPPDLWTLLLSPVFDASHNEGKFKVKFTATVQEATNEEEAVLYIRHWADRRGTAMESKSIKLITDGKAHEYEVECSNGMTNENISIQPGTAGTTIVLSGKIEVEQSLKTGDRLWHSIALTQMNCPAGMNISKVNDQGVKIDTMKVVTSSGAKNVLNHKLHKQQGWRLFYTLFQMIAAEDGMSTRASEYSQPVYFD